MFLRKLATYFDDNKYTLDDSKIFIGIIIHNLITRLVYSFNNLKKLCNRPDNLDSCKCPLDQYILHTERECKLERLVHIFQLQENRFLQRLDRVWQHHIIYFCHNNVGDSRFLVLVWWVQQLVHLCMWYTYAFQPCNEFQPTITTISNKTTICFVCYSMKKIICLVLDILTTFFVLRCTYANQQDQLISHNSVRY